MDAGKHFHKSAEKCLAKQIKLKESPTAHELANQLKVINAKFSYIISSFKSFNLKLEKGSASSPESKQSQS